jgi:predicted RNA-binding protein YlxR (DUF448 family)
MRQHHIPLRTCLASGEKRPKREMIRVVRTTEGRVEMDPTGKKAGRGAYLCLERTCWDQALKKNRLEYALRGAFTPLERKLLSEFAESLGNRDVEEVTDHVSP